MATLSLRLMLSLFSLILIISLLVLAINKKIYHRVLTKSFPPPLPPGPKPWPVFGCLFEMIKNKPAYKWIHKIMFEMNTDIACIRLGHVHVITVTSPELACEILKTQDSIFLSRPLSMVADICSNGYLSVILSPYGDQWKKMKKILVSSLISPTRHAWITSKISEEANHTVRYIFNQCRYSATGGTVMNVRSIAKHYSASVIKSMIFSKRFFRTGTEDRGAPSAEDDEHLNAIFTILAYIHSFSISDFLPWIRIFDLDGHGKIVRESLTIVRKYHDPEINKRILSWENGLKSKEVDFLDVLLMLKDENGKPMLTIEETEALIMDLMIATMDNPSNAVEWTLAEMINEPELLVRAREELDSVVGKERLVEVSDLPKLNYIKACVREAFRLHPIAPFNAPHASTKDTTVGGYFIPKGSHIFLSRLGIGRNPHVWEEPLTFKPERHLKNQTSEVVLNDSELNLFSFGIGRRGCPCVTIGSMMTTLMLARLLQGFTWTIPSDVSKIELTESKNDLFLEKPLLSYVKPRLQTNIYLEG
ncbi:hypothetical protein M9H77_28447 [Catharanthus roseus]|uniref:Uncharacterized protein n=1 Tax=Catharanthus roseus TaxID=4058 RepID=A0ACC0AHM1_CATRO|nr:hypothetical protein M9H77_00449 [Catharanthus roseus]KAI5659654.1 hypothetical protein M9H77_28447 [Catharanthus roseus]